MPAVKLLSAPGVFSGEQRVEAPKGKTSALLYYLAYQGDWVSREDVLYLFWPDTEELKARNNLRQLLSAVRKLPFTQDLETAKGKLRWLVPSDAQTFKGAVEQKQWANAVECYRGPLLETFRPHKFPEFENWLELERAELLRVFKDAALQLSQDFMTSERYKEAAEVLEKVLFQDPFDEVSFRAYLKAVWLSEGRDKAKQELLSYQKALAQELGAEPEAATLNLFEELEGLAQDSEPGSVVVSTKPLGDKPLHNLPFKLTPFVGRAKEKAELADYLANPACRLVTLLGPGGMGKTRLAIAVAEEHLGSFEHGVWFVAFDALENPDAMLYPVAEALSFRFYGQDNPKDQLLNYLNNKDMLLVLDNLEHLLEGTPLITDLLENAPKLKVLATSREVLNLHAEHVFEISGLNFEKQDEVANQRDDTLQEMSDAKRLFMQSAQKRRNLELNEANETAITKICNSVEGMPLAIELAASWLSMLTPQAIANELEQGLGILEGQTRDTPRRHQSIKSVFEYSWNLLSNREQTILARLAVFRGGFTRDAAKAVADASLPILASLVNKSFLRVLPNGRYDRHPLVFEFCLEKLADRDDKQSVHERHAEFFLVLANEAKPKLHSQEQAYWLRYIEEDHDNFLAVLNWAVEQEKAEMGLQLAVELYLFWLIRGYFQLGQTWLEIFEKLLPTEDHLDLRRSACTFIGRFSNNLGNYDKAKILFEKSLIVAQNLNDQQAIATALADLGKFAHEQRNFVEAKKLLAESLKLYRSLNDQRGIAATLRELGKLAIDQSTQAEARRLLEESHTFYENLGDPLGIANSLSSLGFIARIQGRYSEAKKFIEKSLTIYRDLGSRGAVGTALHHLGTIAQDQGHYIEAKKYFEECLMFHRDLGTLRGIAWSLYYVGDVFLDLNLYDEAKQPLEESLPLFRKMGVQGQEGLVFGLADIATSLSNTNILELSVLVFAASQSLCDQIGVSLDQRTKDRIQQSFKLIREVLDETRVNSLWEEGKQLSIDEAIELALGSS